MSVSHIKYMKDKLLELSSKGSVLVFGLGDIPPDFFSSFTERQLKNLHISEESINSFYITSFKKYDYIFLSRVAEHFLPYEHYQNWFQLSKLGKVVISIVPDMNQDFEILFKSVCQDYDVLSLSFRTIRTIFEIYSEGDGIDTHSIYYSKDMLQEKFFKQFIPSFKLKNSKSVYINGYPHIEMELESFESNFEIKVEPKKYNKIKIIIDNINKFICDHENITDYLIDCPDYRKICFENLFTLSPVRDIDYNLYLIRNHIPNNAEILFKDIDKNMVHIDLKQKIKNYDIHGYWDLTRKLLSSTHSDIHYSQLLVIQEGLYENPSVKSDKDDFTIITKVKN